MKLWWSLITVAVALLVMIAATNGESNLWPEEDDKEVLVRTVRGTKDRASANAASCRYTKGQWSECDPKTNTRTRTLSLKKGDKLCQQTKTIQKKCKKACRYEKGQWSSCENGTITRVDTLKENSDPSCEKTRRLGKKCKSETNTKKSPKVWSEAKAAAPRAWRRIAKTTILIDNTYPIICFKDADKISISADEFRQMLSSAAPFVEELQLTFENRDLTVYYIQFRTYNYIFYYKVTMSAHEFDDLLDLLSDTSSLTYIQFRRNIRFRSETLDLILRQSNVQEMRVDASCFNHICEQNFDTSGIKRLNCVFYDTDPGFYFHTFRNVSITSIELSFPKPKAMNLTNNCFMYCSQHFPNLQWLEMYLSELKSKEEFQNVMSKVLPYTKNLKHLNFEAKLQANLDEPVKLNLAVDGLKSILDLSQLEHLQFKLRNFDAELDDEFCEKLALRLPKLKYVKFQGIGLSDTAISLLVTPETECLHMLVEMGYHIKNYPIKRPGELIVDSLRRIPTWHRFSIDIKGRTKYEIFGIIRGRIYDMILVGLSDGKRIVIINKASDKQVLIIKRKDDQIVGGFSEKDTLVLDLVEDKYTFGTHNVWTEVKKNLKTYDDHHAFMLYFSIH